MFGVDPGATSKEEAPEIECGVPETPVSYAGLSWDSHIAVACWTHLSTL